MTEPESRKTATTCSRGRGPHTTWRVPVSEKGGLRASKFVAEGHLHGDNTMSRTGPFTKKLNRRQCLKTAAAAGAACFMPTIIPAVRAGPRRRGRTERTHRAGRHRPRGTRRVRPELDAARERRAICRDLRRAEGAPRRPSSRSSTSITATPTARCIPRCANFWRPGRTSTRS